MKKESKGKWEGKRAIVIARQSDDSDGVASNLAQFEYLLKEFERVGLVYVDKMMLEGVPAVAPARIAEILKALFARKLKDNDFDVIAYHVEDRASRGGGKHGMWLEQECQLHGLRVFFAGDDGGAARPYDDVIKVSKYEAAKESSVSTGRRSTGGQTQAKKTGFFRTAGPTSWGCYRLYCNADHKPTYYIRNLRCGRQELIDYKTGEIIGHFGSDGEKSRHRFKKQRIEYSLLMPGDREQMRIVRVIFYLRYKRGWRGCRIADFLNRLGILSPQGKEWSQRQVQSIYENEAYTGVTTIDRTFSGRFYRRDKNLGYVALDRDEIELVLRKTFTPKLKSTDQWERIDQPYMYDFLPTDLRDLAIVDQHAMWKERADPTRPKRTSNAYPASSYLFSGILTAKQDSMPLTGSMSGPEGHKVPYYRHPKNRKRRKGSIFNRVIPAASLHTASMSVLAEILLDSDGLRPRLKKLLEQQRKAAMNDAPNQSALEDEAKELDMQITATMATLKGAALKAAQAQLERLGKRRNAVEAQLSQIRKAVTIEQRSADDVVEDAISVLTHASDQLLQLPIQPLRDIVAKVFVSAVVDMETKAVEFGVALPAWALYMKPKAKKNAKMPEKTLCLADSLRSQSEWCTQIFAVIRCDYHMIRGSRDPACYHCRRKAA